MKRYVVYKITSPSGRIYIGSTDDFNRRRREYKNGKMKAQHKLNNSFIKYGFDNHSMEIVWEGEKDEMLNKEAYYGNLFSVLDTEKGLNLKLPKRGEILVSFSKEVLEKMSSTRKGKTSGFKGKNHNQDTKVQMSSSQRKRTDWYKRKPKTKGYKVINKGTYNRLAPCKKLQSINTITNEILIHNSAKEASEYFNISRNTIYGCLSGIRDNAFGIKFNYI